MNDKLTLRLRIAITAIVTLLVWGHIAWDHFHGGIPTHYLLHDKDMPGIPNWLGALVLPFFTWFLLSRIHKRIDREGDSENLGTAVRRFVAALLVGISMSVFFTYYVPILNYILLALFVLAFFIPLYKSEYLLGYVLGSAFTFGAIIPMGFGSILALVFFICYKISRVVIGVFKKERET